jgi:branched-chain amino acid transport system substrate-binding protein
MNSRSPPEAAAPSLTTETTSMNHRLLALAAASALWLVAPAASAELRIGFVATLSGSAAALGQDQYDGFMLAIEQKAGKLGGVPVTVIRQDDQLKPDLGVQVVQKLVQKDRVDLVTGITFSNVMMAVARPLADAGVLFVGSNAGPAPLAGRQCSPDFFFTSFQNDNQAEVLGKYTADKGFRKMLLLAPNYQSGKDQVQGFKRFYKRPVAGEIYTQLDQPDYAAELARIQALQPDAVFAFFPGGMGVNFIKQMKQAGLLGELPLLTVSTVDGTTLPAIRDAAVGTLAGAAWGPDLANAANTAFVGAFEKKYGRIPSQYAAQAYDAAALIDSALASTKGSVADRPALRAALRAARFASVRGSFAFNHNGFPIQDQHVFEVAKDAQGRVSLRKIATPLPGLVDAYAGECPLR